MRISAWMLAIPIVLGGTVTHFFLQWNPYSNIPKLNPRNPQEEIETKAAEFRNDWAKNKAAYRNQINLESKACKQEMENSTYELPGPIQNVMSLIEGKNIENPN